MSRHKRRAARADRGLARPGVVHTRTVNLASVSTSPSRVRQVLDRATSGGHDLILAVECGDLTLRDHLDPRVWEVVQIGRHHTDTDLRVSLSGSALIGRRDVVTFELARVRLGSPAGEGIRARYVLSARATFHRGHPSAWRAWVRVGHAPPGRAPVGRRRFLDTLRTLTGIRGGDLNIGPGEAAHRFLAHTRSAGLMHLIVPRWIPASQARARDVGSDHAALDVTLWSRR